MGTLLKFILSQKKKLLIFIIIAMIPLLFQNYLISRVAYYTQVTSKLANIPFRNISYSSLSSGFLAKEVKSSRDLISYDNMTHEVFEIKYLKNMSYAEIINSAICDCVMLNSDEILISRDFAKINNIEIGSNLTKLGLNEQEYKVIGFLDYEYVRLTKDFNNIESLPFAITLSDASSIDLALLSFEDKNEINLTIFSKEDLSRTTLLLLFISTGTSLIYGVFVSLLLLSFASSFFSIDLYSGAKLSSGVIISNASKNLLFVTNLLFLIFIQLIISIDPTSMILILVIQLFIFFVYSALVDFLPKGRLEA
jgi:hypothetical protein